MKGDVIEGVAFTFQMSAIGSLLLGVFSLFLPNTPPRGKEMNATASNVLGLDAFVLFKNKPYLIFFIAAVLVCIPLSFYYELTNLFLTRVGMEDPTSKMALGQVSEALFILAIPFLFHRIGVKNMIIIGMFAWILRYVFFAHGDTEANTWMLYAGIVLHDICYDFFFVTGYMYTETKAGERIKNAAQGLFTFATYGLGMFIGTWIAGFVADHNTDNGRYDWVGIWYVPASIAIFVLLYFIFFFKEKREIRPAS